MYDDDNIRILFLQYYSAVMSHRMLIHHFDGNMIKFLLDVENNRANKHKELLKALGCTDVSNPLCTKKCKDGDCWKFIVAREIEGL